MKIVFFITSLPEDNLENHQFPLGVGYLGAYLEKHLDNIHVVITASPERILKEKPNILGTSSVSQCFKQAKATAALVKRDLDIPIVLGGYHISPLPYTLPACFDVGVLGEGEKQMLEVVSPFQKVGVLIPQKLKDIGGICFHESDKIVVTPHRRSQMIPIDTLPFPMRNIGKGSRNIHMFTSRGCVNRCKYCASSRHWKRFRAFSPEYVVKELLHLIRTYDATSIFLLDDLFFADKKRFYVIADLMKKEGLIGQLTFHGFITSNLATLETLNIVKYIGFRSIRFGAETGSLQLFHIAYLIMAISRQNLLPPKGRSYMVYLKKGHDQWVLLGVQSRQAAFSVMISATCMKSLQDFMETLSLQM